MSGALVYILSAGYSTPVPKVIPPIHLQITEPCRHPTKDVQQTLEQCKGSKVWSTMDLRKGFHQLRLSKSTQELLTVVTLQGAYRPLTAPFGEKSIPAEFQWRMSNQVLSDLGWY